MTRKEQVNIEYENAISKKKELEHKVNLIVEDYIPSKYIWMYLFGIIISAGIDLFILASFPLLSLLFIPGVPMVHQLNRRRKYKKNIKEIKELSNNVIIPLVKELDEIHEIERQEWLKKENERLAKKKNIFVEALKEPMSEYIKEILDKRPDRIPGTDKVRTFAGYVPGLYSEESNLENIIARREQVFGKNNEKGTVRVRKRS